MEVITTQNYTQIFHYVLISSPCRMIFYSKLTFSVVIVLSHVKLVVENCSKLPFSILDCLLLYYILKILFQKNLPSMAFQNKNVTHVSEYFENLMVITIFQCVQIFETTTLRLCVQQAHWARLNLSVQKLLKLNLPE